MTRLHPETLAQLTTAFRWSTAAPRTTFETSTTQLVHVALAELQERRRLDTALVAVVGAAKAVVDRALEEHQTSAAFELVMAQLELALLEFDEIRAPPPTEATAPAIPPLPTTPAS